MVEVNQVYGDVANLRTLKILRWSDHFKDENGQCSCKGKTCTPDKIRGLRRVSWKVKTLLNKASRCSCGNLKCRFAGANCQCAGYGCPMLSASVVVETILTPQGLKSRSMAMPTARFFGPTQKYDILSDDAAINQFWLNCAAANMLSYVPEKNIKG